MFGDNYVGWKWPVKDLGKLYPVGTGGTPDRKNSNYYGGNIPWVKSTEVNYCELYNTEEHITEQALQESNCSIYPSGTVLLAMYGQGTTRGRAAILKTSAAVNQAIAAIRVNDETESVFLYNLLKVCYDYIRNLAVGGNQHNLNLKLVSSIPIVRPPMDLQQQFVSIAEQADKSEFDVIKSQFIEYFGNPVANEKQWKTSPISKVAPESPSEHRLTGEVWLLNLDMIESNTGRVIEKVFESDSNLLSVAPFDEGNVLYSKLRPYLNKVVIPDSKGYATTELIPLRPNQEILNNEFLSYLLRSNEFVSYANSISSGTKMPRMPLADLRKFECILPPMDLQQRFVSFAHQADKSESGCEYRMVS